MNIKQNNNPIKKFWAYLQKDTWDSFIVSLFLIIIIIKFIFFPILSLITGAPLPLVVVESCSMYHSSSNFDNWWEQNSPWYEKNKIEKEDFEKFSLKNGLNKGDIIIVWGREKYKKGDIIIFNPNEESLAKNPVIHRIVSETPLATKGDHNSAQLIISNNLERIDETNINQNQIQSKAIAKIPLIGWLKLIFYEPFRPESERGFCK